MKPNLFDFATRELSHDAILSWILYWGNYKNSDLYNLSRAFVKLLIGRNVDIDKVEIRLEEDNIDILCIINNKIYIVIENKIDTSEHSGQLDKYKNTIDKKYADMERHYAYITVGDEASYDHIFNKSYIVIERKDLINLVSDYKDKNHILKDYYNFLYKIEEDFNSSDNDDIYKWTYRGWQKFYINLNKRFTDGSWSRVNNQRGGFLAFYWDFINHKYEDEVSYKTYIQIEDNERIAFKVEVEGEKYKSEIRNFLWDTVESLDLAEEIKRPARFGYGKTMTFAEIKDYSTKNELYKMINLAEKAKRCLDFELIKSNNNE